MVNKIEVVGPVIALFTKADVAAAVPLVASFSPCRYPLSISFAVPAPTSRKLFIFSQAYARSNEISLLPVNVSEILLIASTTTPTAVSTNPENVRNTPATAVTIDIPISFNASPIRL